MTVHYDWLRWLLIDSRGQERDRLCDTYKALVAWHVTSLGEGVENAVLFPVAQTAILAFCEKRERKRRTCQLNLLCQTCALPAKPRLSQNSTIFVGKVTFA